MIKKLAVFLLLTIVLLTVANCREIRLPIDSTEESISQLQNPSPSETQTSTLEPTPTFSSTETPIPNPTNTAQPTPEPTTIPVREFLSDYDRIAAVYPETVDVVKAKNAQYLPNTGLGISFDLPVAYALQVQSIPENGFWELIGGGLEDNRLLSMSIGIIPKENAPDVKEIESLYSQDSIDSILASIESYEYDNGFGVLYTELYSYKGHYGSDVVYTLVLDYDEENVIGISYFLSEEIFEEDRIDESILNGIALVNEIQQSYTQFKTFDGVLRQSQYRIYIGICPIENDETYGYTQENPIRMTSSVYDPVSSAMMGPVFVRQYFDTLLFDGAPINVIRLGSITTEETILDEYQVTLSDGSMVTLYVDQYNSAPYRVPAGFGCAGILNPEFLMEFEED